VIAAADLLTAAGALHDDPPEVVVRWGALPTSKPVWRWLETHPRMLQVLVDPGGHRDPLGSASLVVRADVAATAGRIHTPGGPPEWADAWRARDAAAQAAIDAALTAEAFPSEPAVARIVGGAAPADGFVFAGSSMPIRDLDAFAAPRVSRSTVVANRGANGIDGSISTALGIAATGRPTVALIGDVAALYDLGALATMRRLDLPLTLVIVHNDGGGIFELLPQADPALVDRDVFERHIATPHGTDFVAVAEALGIPAHRIADASQLAAHVSAGAGPLILEVRTDRSDLAAVHARLRAAVDAALGS
jgi:2-succinyl-5-enolpyruvyl-6-hydroxy-3-cyclohexene-1-carboxylate synthase